MKMLLVVLLVLSLMACATPIPTPINEEQAVKDVVQEYFAAFNAFDYGRAVQTLSRDAPRDKLMEAILWAKTLNFVAEPNNIIVRINGNEAEVIISYKGQNEADTWLLKKETDKWKIVGPKGDT